ncbi:hypothetical protein WR25_13105 isoform D [Diploscapter pachys]|uniref:RRM domain-containing protein n=1 Tax=Diploscapter pachys TaxID=2018661 RepID=A0A2A2LGG2_9BILA|nr:hypothetical protein WR25_13105 isoform B [Diploscapter pachys]PAV85318.1 hypothetical protein WR25_13105 isoform D [Diploscapter pachys]
MDEVETESSQQQQGGQEMVDLSAEDSKIEQQQQQQQEDAPMNVDQDSEAQTSSQPNEAANGSSNIEKDENHQAAKVEGEVDEGELSNQEENEGELSDDEKSSKAEPERKEPEPKVSKLDRLKNLQFAKEDSKKRGTADRRVRSFLHEKGSDPFSARGNTPPKNESGENREHSDSTRERRSDKDRGNERSGSRNDRSPSPSRDERRRRRRPLDDDDSKKPDGYADENLVHHPHDHLPPPVLFTRCNQLISKGEHHASTITDEELRICIADFMDLDHELTLLSEKRKKLKVQMTSMISEEVEVIKRVHSQMPPQLQQIIRIEGDKVTLVENFGPLPPPMGMLGGPSAPGQGPPPGFPPSDMSGPPPLFPPAPSMLGRAPDIGPNGMGSFSMGPVPSVPPVVGANSGTSGGVGNVPTSGAPIGLPPPTYAQLQQQGAPPIPQPNMGIPPPGMNLPPPSVPQAPAAATGQTSTSAGQPQPIDQGPGQISQANPEGRSPNPNQGQHTDTSAPPPKRGRTPPMPPPPSADYSVPPPSQYSMPPPSLGTSQSAPPPSGPTSTSSIPSLMSVQTSLPPKVPSSVAQPLPPSSGTGSSTGPNSMIPDFSRPPPGLMPPSGSDSAPSQSSAGKSSDTASSQGPAQSQQRIMPRAPHLVPGATTNVPPPTQPSGGSALGGVDIVRNLSSFLTSKLKQEVQSSGVSAGASPNRPSGPNPGPGLMGPSPGPGSGPSPSMLGPPPAANISSRNNPGSPMNLGTVRIGLPPGTTGCSPLAVCDACLAYFRSNVRFAANSPHAFMKKTTEMFAPPYCPPEIAELIQQGMLVPIMGPPPASNGPASPQSSGNRSQNGSSPSPPNGTPRYPIYAPMPPFSYIHPMIRAHTMGFPNEGPPQMRKLFIGGLSHETTDDQLRVYFSQWGPVVDAIVIREPNTKQSRGFGFVTFATVYSAEAAIADRPHIIAGKTVDSKRAIPREQMTAMLPPPFFNCEPAPGCKLLLSGLHFEYHSVDCIRLYFEKFGSLDQVEILGNPRGLGFVIFEEKESADKCLAHNRYGRSQ